MARKKKSEQEIIVEVSKLTAEETLTATDWPKVFKGSHSTIIEHQDGGVEMSWDWEQLNKDINNAIREYEHSQSGKNAVSEISPKIRSKSNGKKGKKNELV